MELVNLGVINRFPQVTGSDAIQFNPNLRRWYTASSSNLNLGTGLSAGKRGGR